MAYNPNYFITSKLTLTSSEIKNLSSNPLTLIDAPGENKFIFLFSALSQYFYAGNNTFIGGSNINIYLNDTVNPLYLISTCFTNASLILPKSTFSYKICNSIGGSTASINILNKPLILSVPTANFSGNDSNDNTINIVITYSIIDFG